MLIATMFSLAKGRGCGVGVRARMPWNLLLLQQAALSATSFASARSKSVLAEIDALIARGVNYVYFIDEIFGVGKNVRILLEEIANRSISIGLQTRIDLWDEESLDCSDVHTAFRWSAGSNQSPKPAVKSSTRTAG